jgi:uncharacterized membrane protein
MKLGIYVFGLASIAAGIINLVWGGFEGAHQPIQAFGNVPGQQIIAYVVSAVLVAGGIAVLVPRTARAGAIALAIVYALFTIFWLPRLYTAPHVLGWHAGVVIGVLGGVCQQLILAAAAVLIYAYASALFAGSAALARTARWIFALSAILFGLGHLTGIAQTAAMVPGWLPFGQVFWVILTGAAFVLAGVSILIEILDVLSARLMALMLVVFSALALAPVVIAYPHNHVAWGSNAYNIAAAASVWIFASWIAAPQRVEEHSAAFA